MTRYRMLETIREYAGEKLRAPGEEEAVRKRLIDWCVRFGTCFETEATPATRPVWLARVDAEYPNLRIALGEGSLCCVYARHSGSTGNRAAICVKDGSGVSKR